MSIQDRRTLKVFFEEGKKPSEENFSDLIDSMSHKEEIIKTDVAFASLLDAREGVLNDRSMSPFLVFEAIKVLVKLANTPTLENEVEQLITTAIDSLKGGVSSNYDTLSEIVTLVDTKATPLNITTAISEIKGNPTTNANSLEKIEQLINAINSTLQSDTETLDNIQELVNYMKANKSDITSILSDKLSIGSLFDNLNSKLTKTAITANQVRIL